MLHLQPVPGSDQRPEAYAEAISRLASVRHALRLVDPFGGGPASDVDGDEAVACAWAEATEAKPLWFDIRSVVVVGAPAAGVGVLPHRPQNGGEPHPLASQE